MRGRLLRAARALKGFTQAEVAERVGCARESVSLAERGYPMKPSVSAALATVLDVDLTGEKKSA